MPSAPLLLRCPLWLQSLPHTHPPSPPVKGLPSVWKLFLLHSSLPEVQVPSLFFCLCSFFFLLPYPGTWGFSCLLGSLRSSASIQEVFCRSCSTSRCISDVFVGRKVISASYSSSILKVLPNPFEVWYFHIYLQSSYSCIISYNLASASVFFFLECPSLQIVKQILSPSPFRPMSFWWQCGTIR